MSEYKEIFITQETKQGLSSYSPGNAYVVSAAEADKLIADGKAEHINFESLQTIKLEADTITEDYKARREEILNSPRFADNPAEKAYQENLLEQEIAFKIAEQEFKIKAELQALRIDSASKALSPVGTALEVETAKTEVDAIVTQLLISNNPAEVYDLLSLKVNTMTDADKVETLKRFGEITARATTRDAESIKQIEKGLRTIDNSHLRTLKHIRALEKSGVTASQKYKTMKLVQKQQRGKSYE